MDGPVVAQGETGVEHPLAGRGLAVLRGRVRQVRVSLWGFHRFLSSWGNGRHGEGRTTKFRRPFSCKATRMPGTAGGRGFRPLTAGRRAVLGQRRRHATPRNGLPPAPAVLRQRAENVTSTVRKCGREPSGRRTAASRPIETAFVWRGEPVPCVVWPPFAVDRVTCHREKEQKTMRESGSSLTLSRSPGAGRRANAQYRAGS